MAELNGVMMQYFQWYLASDGSHWEQLKNQAQDLANSGFTALWLPPAYKGSGGSQDVGYSAYDLFDLGEFNQKGSIPTKYGSRNQYLAAIQAAQQVGLQIYADVVFNHKNGADVAEEVVAVPVSKDDRNQGIGHSQTVKIGSYFTFPGRNGKYSSLQWRWWHFDSVNHNLLKPGDRTIYRLKDKQFDTEVDPRHGNDFLMACDLDTSNPEVQENLKQWGEWILDTTKVNGFRFDAVKHVRAGFFIEWLTHVQTYAKQHLFTVGEYWAEDVESLHQFISNTNGQICLFDVPLHYNFHRASRVGRHFDMRRILFGTLMREQPALAVTFVENHNSQPLQAWESVIEPWFKPLAYAIILLRREGYPCVFYGDYYGAHYTDKGQDGQSYEIWLNCYRGFIDQLLYIRKHYAYGDQHDYFDHPSCIAWTRLGNAEHPHPIAVILSNGPAGSKWMEVRKPNATFRDITGHMTESVQTNEFGWGNFCCTGESVSVWVEAEISGG